MQPLILPEDRFVLRCLAVYFLIGLAILIYEPNYGMMYFFGTVVVGAWALFLWTIGLVVADCFRKD